MTVTLINTLAFTALFIFHVTAMPAQRPVGLRRALQTYAGQFPTGGSMTKPVWQIGVDASDMI
jgi:hypothetical protein